MKLLVTGSRDWTNWQPIRDCIERHRPDIVITGGAPGADSIAANVAQELGITLSVYMADWKRLGKKAGPMRNQKMLDDEQPDLVCAFPVDGSVGTWDMVRRAKEAGVKVEVWRGE